MDKKCPQPNDPVRVQREESFQTSGPPVTLVVGHVTEDLARAIREGVDARLRAVVEEVHRLQDHHKLDRLHGGHLLIALKRVSKWGEQPDPTATRENYAFQSAPGHGATSAASPSPNSERPDDTISLHDAVGLVRSMMGEPTTAPRWQDNCIEALDAVVRAYDATFAPREPAQERQEAPEPPQHAEAMADLLRELEGWKDGPNTSDDTRRKHWLMRRAAATIRQLRRDARDPVEGCRMYYNGLNMADQIIQCYPTDLAKAQAGIRDAMKREREQIDRLTAHWRGPVGIQATQAQNESSPLPTGTPEIDRIKSQLARREGSA